MRRRFLIVSAVVIMLSGFATGQASAKTRRHQTIVTTKKVNKTKYHIKHENQKVESDNILSIRNNEGRINRVCPTELNCERRVSNCGRTEFSQGFCNW